MNTPSPHPPDPPEPFPFGTAFRAACIVVFVVTFAVGIIRETRWGLDSEKIMVFGGLAIALFFVSLWFSELRCGKILTEQHKGVSRWGEPAKFRRVMIGEAFFLLILLALMAIGTFKAYFGAKPEPHAESAELESHAESAENAEPEPHAESVEGAESNPTRSPWRARSRILTRSPRSSRSWNLTQRAQRTRSPRKSRRRHRLS